MSEVGGLDIGMPDEGSGGASETVREQASQSFAASQQQAQQQQKEEKKAKKRDNGVADVIIQFLTDTQRTHLATLIARLIARDCPTTFVLAVLSLINEKCAQAVHDYLQEKNIDVSGSSTFDHSIIPTNSALTEIANEQLAAWIMRMEFVMRADGDAVVHTLMVEDNNIDGTILQLTAFVLEEFLKSHDKSVPFENLQTIAAGILQSLFQPHVHAHMERKLAEKPLDEDE